MPPPQSIRKFFSFIFNFEAKPDFFSFASRIFIQSFSAVFSPLTANRFSGYSTSYYSFLFLYAPTLFKFIFLLSSTHYSRIQKFKRKILTYRQSHVCDGSLHALQKEFAYIQATFGLIASLNDKWKVNLRSCDIIDDVIEHVL